MLDSTRTSSRKSINMRIDYYSLRAAKRVTGLTKFAYSLYRPRSLTISTCVFSFVSGITFHQNIAFYSLSQRSKKNTIIDMRAKASKHPV